MALPGENAGMRCALPTIVLLLAVHATLGAAALAHLDGTEHDGETLTINADGTQAVLDGQAFALRDLDWMRFGAPAVPRSGGMAVVLADGGWLPIEGVTPASDDRLSFVSPLGALALAPGAFRAWGSDEWLERTRSIDQDIVKLESGLYAGTLIDVRDGQVQIDIADVGATELPVAQVEGLRLAVPERNADGLQLGATLLAGRPAVRLLPGPTLRLAANQQELSAAPPGRLLVFGGRRVWLGQLEPERVEEAGAFGVVWPYSVDHALDGGLLSLDGQRYQRGLAVHSKARLVWDLGGAFLRLRARCGIATEVAEVGSCAVRLLGDGRELWRDDQLDGSDGAVELDLDLTGVERLELLVDYGERYDIGDHVVLADAWLLRAE